MNTIKIYDIPLYYISFARNVELENHFVERGFKNINHFKAINGKDLDIKKCRENNIISIRSYNDLINGRDQHSGLPTTGAIGCTLSHMKLWQKCIEDNLDYIIIAEDDVIIYNNFTEKDIKNISDILHKPKSAFFTTNVLYDKNIRKMWGLHFYIISKEACKELVQDALPIDVQTDHYITHKADLNRIIINGDASIAGQKLHTSSIQDVCIKCYLPRKSWFYYIILCVICVICICLVIFMIYYFKCKRSKNESKRE